MALTQGPCGHCGRPVIGGWSGNGRVLSVQVTVDATPLTTPEQELAAAVAGRDTWTLHPVAGELHPRGPFEIRHRPAGTRPGQTVHPAHVCTPPAGRTRP